jgi:iron complex outermembrane receptor protein
LSADWQLTEQLRWNGKVSYSSGRDDDGDPLPLISPISWQTELQYHYQRLQVQAVVKGNTRQSNYGDKYGETPASEWAILNLSAQYSISSITVRAGVENLFDKRYATYADWNHIPQKGRNIYMNLTFAL